jgi:hypothetical protein
MTSRPSGRLALLVLLLLLVTLPGAGTVVASLPDGAAPLSPPSAGSDMPPELVDALTPELLAALRELMGASLAESGAAGAALGPQPMSALASDRGAPSAGLAVTAQAVRTAQSESDRDGDGLRNALERDLGLDPDDPDTDGDGTDDGDEDTDEDGLPNIVEVRLGLNAGKRDTDGDGLRDGREDKDRDGLTNAFELRSRTNPNSKDSDRDGILDGLEDPDRDLLANKGEQRFKTRPRDADTDDDGRNDWREDRDRDGRSNGIEQDGGPLRGPIDPQLAQAALDVPPIHHRDCHSRGTSTIARTCTWTFGPKKGRRTVVMTGDSHAAHWLPAILRLAQEHGWRVITVTKSACPFADVLPQPGDARARACVTWRKNAWARIRSINPRLVIAASLDAYQFWSGGRWTRNDKAWKAGVTRSLRAIRKGRTKVLLLGDIIPWGKDSVIPCLRANKSKDISVCSPRRDSERGRMTQRRDKLERAATSAVSGAKFGATKYLVCPYDPCPVVVDGMLVTRDGGHLSATYSRALWRGLDKLLPDL